MRSEHYLLIIFAVLVVATVVIAYLAVRVRGGGSAGSSGGRAAADREAYLREANLKVIQEASDREINQLQQMLGEARERALTAEAEIREMRAALRAAESEREDALIDATRVRTEAAQLRQALTEARQIHQRDADMMRILTPLRDVVSRVNTRVETMEKERVAAQAELAKQLEYARQTDHELREATRSISGALRSSSARGSWGEISLRRVIEAAGMTKHVDFSEQAAIASLNANRERALFSPHDDAAAPPAPTGASRAASSAQVPDVVVHLPGHGCIPIDAKVPMEAFTQAAASEDPAEQTRLLAAHAKAVRGHIDALYKRAYPRQLAGSVDFTVLYLPLEPLLSAALEADPQLLDYAFSRGVTLASPTTLLALLRTAALLWHGERAEDDARQLLALGAQMTERLAKVAEHMTRLGGSLRAAVTSYNAAVGSMESRLLVTARSLASAEAHDLRIAPLDGEEASPRAFLSPELTEPERSPGEPSEPQA